MFYVGCVHDVIPTYTIQCSEKVFLPMFFSAVTNAHSMTDSLEFSSCWHDGGCVSVLIEIVYGAHFPNKSCLFVNSLSKNASPLVGKSTTESHHVTRHSSFASSWFTSMPITIVTPGCLSRALSAKSTMYCISSDSLYLVLWWIIDIYHNKIVSRD